MSSQNSGDMSKCPDCGAELMRLSGHVHCTKCSYAQNGGRPPAPSDNAAGMSYRALRKLGTRGRQWQIVNEHGGLLEEFDGTYAQAVERATTLWTARRPSDNGQSVKAPYAAEYVQRCVELNAKVGDGLAYVRLDCLRTLLAEREELVMLLKQAEPDGRRSAQFKALWNIARARLVGGSK